MLYIYSHEGPVWQVAWAHPKFGSLLASCSYDGKVIIYKEQSLNQWVQAHVHSFHESSVNSIAWAPYEYGLSLACGGADGNVSILSYSGKIDALYTAYIYGLIFMYKHISGRMVRESF
jgi:protein transport protein SEC13